TSSFTWGLLLGLVFAGFAAWNLFRSSRELRRYKRHLSDKLEIEADQHSKLKLEKEKLAKENENLRIKVGTGKDAPARELQRELEIFARAEKAMMINAPGFAGAWETAKSAAIDEITEEEQGKSLPRKIYRKLVRSGGEKTLESAEEAVTGEPKPSAAAKE
ncbi:MAG: hypothetical protein AAF585_29745, partial [Verrucomicrobiota bacterium]